MEKKRGTPKEAKQKRSRRREHIGQRVAPQQWKQPDKGFWEDLADLVIGPDQEPYGFLLASLDESDKNCLHQLRALTDVTPNKRSVFQLLTTMEYEKSIVPFTSDENPFGDIAATGIGLVVPDGIWGPDLLEDSSEEDNYWQLIDAAQELALNVVFIFIKHKDSEGMHGVCHQKFERLTRGPWPKKQPYVFLMSFWEKFNSEQIEVIKSCLAVKDPFQVKVEINRYANQYKNQKMAAAVLEKGPTPAALVAPSNNNHVKEKGKEKVGKPQSDIENLVEFKRQLLWENEKQFATFRGELKELKDEVARLKLELAKAKGENASDEKGGSS